MIWWAITGPEPKVGDSAYYAGPSRVAASGLFLVGRVTAVTHLKHVEAPLALVDHTEDSAVEVFLVGGSVRMRPRAAARLSGLIE